MKKTVALTAGTFDPVTLGHLDVIRAAAEKYDSVVVGIFENPSKTPTFSLEKRYDALCAATADIQNVTVTVQGGMLYEYAVKIGASAIVKGVRNDADRAYEKLQADFNFEHSHIETVLFEALPEHKDISSSLVRKLLAEGENIRRLLPDGVYEILMK